MEKSLKKQRVTYTTRLDEELLEWVRHQAINEKTRVNLLIEEGIELLKKSRKEPAQKNLLE